MDTQHQYASIVRRQTCVTQLQVALHYSPRTQSFEQNGFFSFQYQLVKWPYLKPYMIPNQILDWYG